MRSFLFFLLLTLIRVSTFAQELPGDPDKKFTSEFDTRSCTFQTTGRNHFFILEPGFRLVLKGMAGKDTCILSVSVLDSVKEVGGIQTRIVEERESTGGKLTEVSRNYFAFCKQTGTVFYFGEEVENYRNGKYLNRTGSWLAEADFLPGVAMPGLPLLGARYCQEIAAGVAMDRAEIVSLSESISTPAGNFPGCLKTEETSALDPGEKEYKVYAPGIGLIKDEGRLLTSYGFVKK